MHLRKKLSQRHFRIVFSVTHRVTALFFFYRRSHSNTLTWVGPNLEEERVVLDIVAQLKDAVRHKPGKSKSQLIRILASRRPHEIRPLRVRNEGLDHVDGAAAIRILIEQREGDRMAKRPFKHGVRFAAGQDFDVDGHVAAFAAAVPIREQGGLQPVARRPRQKRRRDQFEALLGARLRHLGPEVCDAPYEDAVPADASVRQLGPEGRVADPDSIGSVDPDSESGSGSRRAKITHKSVEWPLLRAEGFFCNLDVLYGRPRDR